MSGRSFRGPRQNALNRGATTLVGLLLGGALAGCGGGQDNPAPGSDDVDTAAGPPWAAPTNVTERVELAGLDLGPMGTAEHYHPHLSVIIDGRDVPVPSNIGVDPASGAMSAVHTHEGDGTIHIEASTVGETYTLGQLFTQWGVALRPNQVGQISAASGDLVEVTSNGVKVQGDPNDLRLEPDQKIVVRLRSIAG